jgi:hypothetical protein
MAFASTSHFRSEIIRSSSRLTPVVTGEKHILPAVPHRYCLGFTPNLGQNNQNRRGPILRNRRASIYLDGNALFRAIDDMNESAFRWLDPWKLGSMLTGSGVTLGRAVFAYNVTGEDRSAVHHERAYLRALGAIGVECLVEDASREFHECSRCGHGWDERRARRNEADLAVEILDDAWRDEFDEALYVTDDVSTSNLARRLSGVGGKTLTLVCLRSIPRQLKDTPELRRRALTKRHLREAQLPDHVSGEGEAVTRPRAWAPRPSATWNDLEITGL